MNDPLTRDRRWSGLDIGHPRDVAATACVVIACVLACIAAVLATPAAYHPGTPLWREMPIAFHIAIATAVAAFALARSGDIRLICAVSGALIAVLPVVVLCPVGILHDSSRNLLIAEETLAGRPTGMYHDAYPGFWFLIGLLRHLGGGNAWDVLRWYPLWVTAIYSILLYLLGTEVFAAFGYDTEARKHGVAATILIALVIGSMIWMRNNLAPETFGFSIGIFLTFLTLRAAIRWEWLALMGVAVVSLVVSHPLSPILIFPGMLAALAIRSSTFREVAVRTLNKSIWVLLPAAVLYLGWIMFQSSWIIDHARGIVVDALESEKHVSGLNRFIPGTEQILFENLAFLLTLFIALAPLGLVALTTPLRKLVVPWGLFMAPILVGSVGGRFFSRPLLFLLVPLGLAIGASLTLRGKWISRVALTFLVLAALLGALRTGYVESIDRPTASEIDAYTYAFTSSNSVYRPALNLHYDLDGHRIPSGDPLLGGGRAYNPARASEHDLRIVSAQTLAYSAWEKGRAPSDVAQDARFEAAGLVYSNGESFVFSRSTPEHR